MRTFPPKSFPANRSGFSLAESIIAMGIVAFTLLTIIGLLPSSLDALKQAEDRAARARIMTTLFSEHEALSWSTLETLENQFRGPIGFDRQGLKLSSSAEDQPVYFARTRVTMEQDTRSALANSGTTSPFLRMLEITVSSHPDGSFDETVPDQVERRTFMLVRTECLAPQGELQP